MPGVVVVRVDHHADAPTHHADEQRGPALHPLPVVHDLAVPPPRHALDRLAVAEEPDVDRVGGDGVQLLLDLVPVRHPRLVHEHEARVALGEEVAEGLCDPRAVSDLDRVPLALARQVGEEAVQAVQEGADRRERLAVEVGELEHERPEARSEPAHHLEEPVANLVRLVGVEDQARVGRGLPAGVHDVARELRRDEERGRRLLGPPVHETCARNAVVRRVHLDGVELARVVREEGGRGRAGRIERPHPVFGRERGGAEADDGLGVVGSRRTLFGARGVQRTTGGGASSGTGAAAGIGAGAGAVATGATRTTGAGRDPRAGRDGKGRP